MLKVGENEEREADVADSAVEKRCVETKPLYSGRDGVPESELGKGRGGEKEDESVGFAMAEDRSDKKDAEEKLCKVGEGRGVWSRKGEKRSNGTSDADDIDGVLCAEEGGALVVVTGVLVGKGAVVAACAEGSWEERRLRARTVPLSAGRENCEAYVCGEKTTEGSEARRVAPLMVLDARNSSNEKGAV